MIVVFACSLIYLLQLLLPYPCKLLSSRLHVLVYIYEECVSLFNNICSLQDIRIYQFNHILQRGPVAPVKLDDRLNITRGRGGGGLIRGKPMPRGHVWILHTLPLPSLPLSPPKIQSEQSTSASGAPWGKLGCTDCPDRPYDRWGARLLGLFVCCHAAANADKLAACKRSVLSAH